MRRRLIAGNWKMYMTPQETEAFIASFLDRISGSEKVEILLIPPYTSLERAARLLERTTVELGGQDLHFEERGAFTGAVSGGMIRASGCSHVLVGHSERRHIFGDNKDAVYRKLRAALSAGLLPILCVGELLEERRSERTRAVITSQLETALREVDADEITRITIAYEPVWAIGTGETATPDQAQGAASVIRAWVASSFGVETADAMRILYGGSVKPENTASLVSLADIDGALVGGASLDPDAFAQIVEEASNG